MNKLLTILLLSFLFISCSKKLAPGINTDVKEKVITNTVYVPKDSIIYMPGDRVLIREEVPCPEADYAKEATSKTGKTKATVTIKKGILNVDCKTDSLEARVKWLEAQTNIITEKQTTITITKPPKRFIPKWVWWVLGINVFYILLRIALMYFKIPIRL